MSKSQYKRIKIMSEERGDFCPLEDGYIYFWPNRQCGAISSSELRILADILDDKNKAWDEQVTADLKILEARRVNP